MLIDPSNHFICFSIGDCMDGVGTTTQSCTTSPPKQSKAKFDLFQYYKYKKKMILEQKIKDNRKFIMEQRGRII